MFQYISVILLVLPALTVAQDDWKAAFESLFDAVDLDGDGQANRNDLDVYFLTFDTNDDGRISRHEFTEQVDLHEPAFIGYEHELYDSFDLNGDHHLDHVDFDLSFSRTDVNNDGIVTRQEYMDAVNAAFAASTTPSI